MRSTAVFLSALIGLVPACKRSKTSGDPAAADGQRESGLAPKGPLQVPAAVPADASMLLMVRTPSTALDTLVSVDPFGSPEVEEIDALRKEIDGYLEAHIGLRLSDTRAVAMFGIEEGGALRSGAVLIGTEGEPRGTPLGSHAGVEMVRLPTERGSLVAARVDRALVLGEEAAVKAAIDQAASGAKGPLAQSLEAAGDGVAVGLAVDFDSALGRELDPPEGIEGMLATLGNGGATVILSGQAAALERLKGQITTGFTFTVQQLENEKKRALQGDDASLAMAATLGHYWARRFQAVFTPVLAGDKLVLDVDISMRDPAMLSASLGIVAAIAIPALTKYMRRSKTSEARVNVAVLFDGASAFFHEEHAMRGEVVGTLPPHMCPSKPGKLQGSSGITPPLSVNCNDGPGGRCVPATGSDLGPGYYDVSLWTDNPVWAGLNFVQEQAHYYHYNFVYSNAATGFGECMFTAQAFGDLDDDGVFSTYERSGMADMNGVNAAAGLYIDLELE